MTNTASNVTPIESKQLQAQCEFKITCMLRGYPVEITGQGRASDLKIVVDRLFDLGACPPQVSTPEPTKPAGVPTCPVHGSKMKEGRRGFFCPRKVGDGYCGETA